jgi:hypothetical protein
MNRKIHLLLVLGCVVIAALDAPRATRLFSEGLSGPYEESARAREAATVVPPARPAAQAAPKRATESELRAAAAARLLNTTVQVEPSGDATR